MKSSVAVLAAVGVASAMSPCFSPVGPHLPLCDCDCADGPQGPPGDQGPEGDASGKGITGGGQPHNNMQPFLGINYIIALSGVFPSRAGREAEVLSSEPLLGNIVLFAGNFAPRGWALCEGQLLPISQNTALFSLLGTTYGGDGRTTFGLPDLRGRAPVHVGRGPGLSDRRWGERGGAETVTLATGELPGHNHN